MDGIFWKMLAVFLLCMAMLYASPRTSVEKLSRWDPKTVQTIKTTTIEPTPVAEPFKLEFPKLPTFHFTMENPSTAPQFKKTDGQSIFPKYTN